MQHLCFIRIFFIVTNKKKKAKPSGEEEARLCANTEIGVPRGSRFQSMVWNGLLPAFVVNSKITFRGAYFSFNYLRFIWAPYQNALT